MGGQSSPEALASNAGGRPCEVEAALSDDLVGGGEVQRPSADAAAVGARGSAAACPLAGQHPAVRRRDLRAPRDDPDPDPGSRRQPRRGRDHPQPQTADREAPRRERDAGQGGSADRAAEKSEVPRFHALVKVDGGTHSGRGRGMTRRVCGLAETPRRRPCAATSRRSRSTRPSTTSEEIELARRIQARRRRGRCRQTGGVQPPVRGGLRQAVPQPQRAVPRPDPRGQSRV